MTVVPCYNGAEKLSPSDVVAIAMLSQASRVLVGRPVCGVYEVPRYRHVPASHPRTPLTAHRMRAPFRVSAPTGVPFWGHSYLFLLYLFCVQICSYLPLRDSHPQYSGRSQAAWARGPRRAIRPGSCRTSASRFAGVHATVCAQHATA